MKKSLKRRFVIGAMLSFLILIMLLVGSIALLIYHEQEQRADEFVATLLSEDTRLPQAPPPNWFGYQFTRPTFPTGVYVIEATDSGMTFRNESMGIPEDEEQDIAVLAEQIIAARLTDGKTGAYKFRASYEDGQARLVLVDQSPQVNALYSVIRTGAAVGGVCLLVLFVLLQPIAGYAVGAWLRRTEQQKQFITNAGHELKTPVAIIMSNTEALELMEGENKYSRNIHQQTLRLDKLIRQLLMIARVDEVRFRDQMEKIDLSVLAEECLRAFEAPLAERGMTVRTQIAPSCLLRGHRESLRQMIEVLFDNALQYGAENSCIHAELVRAHGQLRLTLINAVDDLPECEPAQLFQRFYRADKARTQSGAAGCGVGLSAAQTIAQLHHGTVVITYPAQQRFCVTVTLPAKG